MPLAAPVSIANAALIIKAAIDDWCGPKGASCKIIANVAHLWEELSVTKDKPRILICFTGEESRGESAMRGHLQRVDRQWQIVVIRGHGFKNRVAEAAGNADAFYTNLEEIRSVVRTILNISEEFPVEYIGMEPLPNLGPNQGANVFLDATSMRFTTANDLPRVTTTIANP
jgi:hypothetical protein